MSRGRSPPTSRESPNLTSRGRPALNFKERPWEVDSEHPKDLHTTQTLISQNIFKLFFQILFDWPNISKSIWRLKGVLRTQWNLWDRAFFAKLVSYFLVVNYFFENTSSYKYEWVLNMWKILSSNFIWHAYRLIV